jgi:hypothetical protein
VDCRGLERVIFAGEHEARPTNLRSLIPRLLADKCQRPVRCEAVIAAVGRERAVRETVRTPKSTLLLASH